MFLDYTDEQRALRKELREYFAELLTPELRAELGAAGEGSAAFRTVVRRIGADGWLGIGWPKEYGGQGRDAFDQFIFFDEVQRAAAPFPFVTINTVGPTLMTYGTEEQKQQFLPPLCSGEHIGCFGLSEPEAGSDAGNCQTRAVLDGDHFVVNGAKMWITNAAHARTMVTTVKTDPEAPRSRGISALIIDLESPGIEIPKPEDKLGLRGSNTNQVFLKEVRVA